MPKPKPAPFSPALPGDDARCPGRADGEATRERLLRCSLQLFASQGFAATSTRELALAAGVNVAAISYYFGDKAGLYRAVFFEPLGKPMADVARFSCPAMSLEDALRGFYASFVAPLALGEDGQRCVKLRMREMLEPTGLWQQEVDEGIRPLHDALVAVICRHLGLAAPDDEVHRLVVCISALGVHLHLGRDVIDTLAPQLNAAGDATARWADCLLRQALAMVGHEQQRRRQLTAPTSPAGLRARPTTPGAVP